MFELRGAVAVVTGASSGLGRRFALDLATHGATVVGIARRADLLASLSEEMRSSSPSSSTTVCDVGDTEAFKDVLAAIEKEHGRIDVLVNDAGIGEPPRGASDGDVMAPYRRVMDVNFFGAVAGALTVLPGMEARRRGVIVNVSSDSGRAPGPREGAYGASKAALSAFTESLSFTAEESGVHVHVLYPGWVPTPMGAGAVQDGMRMPPRSVRRTEEQVSKLLLDKMGGAKVDVDATAVARLAPLARVLFPSAYRRAIRKAT